MTAADLPAGRTALASIPDDVEEADDARAD